MELLQRYELMLVQALEELGPVETPEDAQRRFEVQAVLAPQLGDILYRLAIEHAVAFTPFRETVISLITEPEPVTTKGRSGSAPAPFAKKLEHAHPLILLALEMMPPDPAY